MKVLSSEPDSRSELLANRTGLPLTSTIASSELALTYSPAGLELRGSEDKPGAGVRVDSAWLRHALKRGAEHLRGDPLARALAAPINTQLFVVDSTAGLGGDALLFAALGHRVIAIERNIAVWALLEDGLMQLQTDPSLSSVAARIELRHGNACEILRSIVPAPDIIYIDPMFPPKRRASALPPLAMQRLRMVVGDDTDAAVLFEVALSVAAQRVVVKRPNDSKPLAEGAIASHRGKTVHYDVYRRR